MNRNSLTSSFFPSDIPILTCPNCYNETLKCKIDEIKYLKSSESEKEIGIASFLNDNGRFFLSLKCLNTNCRENVICTGLYETVEYPQFNENGEFEMLMPAPKLTPTFFNPCIPIFKISPLVPVSVKNEVNNAFGLYWFDVNSCCNKIRTIVEQVLNDLKIAKYNIIKGKRNVYKLHKRIELLKDVNPEISDSLMAVKWIGNSASHANSKVTKDDAIDGFKILEFTLNRIYDKSHIKILKLARSINLKRKPINRRNKGII